MIRQWATKNLCVGSRLDQPVTESLKQGNTVFEIFDILAKTKDFPKTIKNLFMFDQQGLSMWKHI